MKDVYVCPQGNIFPSFCLPPPNLKMLLLPIYLLCLKERKEGRGGGGAFFFSFYMLIDGMVLSLVLSLSLLLSKLSQSLIPCRWM